MILLPSVMCKWKSDEQVLVPLIEVVQHLKLEHYSLRHREEDFGTIVKFITEMFFLHSSKRVMDACMDVLCKVIGEGTFHFREMCAQCGKDVLSVVAKRIGEIVGSDRSERAREVTQSKFDKSSEENDVTPQKKNDEFDHLQMQIALLRLNSFLSFILLPISLTGLFSKYDDIH